MDVLTPLARWYFASRSWETMALYEALGSRVFKQAVVALGRRIAGKRRTGAPIDYFLRDPSPRGVEKLERATRIFEVHHLMWFVVTGIVFIGFLLDGRLRLAGLMGALAVLNVYCVVLQRYNRLRLLATLERLRVREARRTLRHGRAAT
jgi:hypothetical protein